MYEVSNVDDLDESVKRRIEEKCGKHKPGISLYLSASVNWRGRSFKNKPLQMQMSGKRFLTQMALQSRRLKHFQPAKLTEWTSGKDIFFIRCRKRTTSGTQRSDSYLCVRKHRVKKPTKTRNARGGDMPIENSSQGKDDPLEEKASPSKEDQLAQDNNDQSKESKATESSKSHEDKPEEEATQTSQGEDDRAEEKSSQGSIQQAQGESSQGIEQAVEETSQSKEEIEGKSSEENIEQAEEKAKKSKKNDDQSDKVPFELFEAKKHRDYDISYSVGCEPRIDKHNDEDTFMLFRLLKSKIEKSMYLEPYTSPLESKSK